MLDTPLFYVGYPLFICWMPPFYLAEKHTYTDTHTHTQKEAEARYCAPSPVSAFFFLAAFLRRLIAAFMRLLLASRRGV